MPGVHGFAVPRAERKVPEHPDRPLGLLGLVPIARLTADVTWFRITSSSSFATSAPSPPISQRIAGPLPPMFA